MNIRLQQVAKDQAVLEKAEGFPESDSSETTRLRQILLQQQNELMQTEERVGKLEREINKWVDTACSMAHHCVCVCVCVCPAAGLRTSSMRCRGSMIVCQRKKYVCHV